MNWRALTPLDRGCTFVHESSHACLGTEDLQYDPALCARLDWGDATMNAQNYAVFCQRAFCACLSGEMLQVAPCLESNKFNWNTTHGGLRHTLGAFESGKFLLTVIGDIYGERFSEPGAKIYHKIYQQVQVLNSESGGHRFVTLHTGLGLSDHAASSTSYKCKSHGEELSEGYVTIGDGMNTSFVKMLSPDVGIGLTECGGKGGRSIEYYLRNGILYDGKISR
mmetsp:Transcript_74560/g.193826  ORF Transcript_74560/g.193826 Transcript_74560/m.193826 type:complete len:223 (-) Transcript_74560:152-820(-)